jgi:CHAT domain-containing protein
LQDRQGAYLIEKYPISYAPSATEYVRSTRAASQARPASTKPRIFAAAASFFDPDVFENLSPLRAAEFEVERIARFHSGMTHVSGRELTPERFLSEAAEAEIVHFAGHAVLGAMDTGAALVMAPDVSRGDAGVLYARAIAQHQFTRTRLVVLAACGVDDRSEADTRAVGSVAHAFLVAGVPAVIATLRPMDDEVAAEFMPRFHAAFAQSGNAAAALRQAQISFIRGRDPATRDPRTWGAFRLYGHYEK